MVSKLENLALPPWLDSKSFTEDQAQMLIDNFIDKFQRTDVAPNFSLNDFFVLVSNAVKSRQLVENVPDGKMLLFVEDDPPEKLDTETITFELIRRENGSFSQGAPGQGSVKELKPHIRGDKQHPEHPGERLVTFGKFYDNWVDFNIYARTNKQARVRLLWFEELMNSYAWYFALFGFKNVIYQGTSRRERSEIGGHKVTKYPVTYFVRTDDIYHVSYQELKKVTIATIAKI